MFRCSRHKAYVSTACPIPMIALKAAKAVNAIVTGSMDVNYWAGGDTNDTLIGGKVVPAHR